MAVSRRATGYVLLLAAALAAPTPWVGVYPIFLMKCLCFALFACAFNLLIGYTGLLSFGHAAFFGTAGYLAGFAARQWSVSMEVGLLIGAAGSALLGLLIGCLAVRRQGIYFAMITLALAQMVYFLCVQAPFTHAEDGLQAIPRNTILGVISLSSDLAMYYAVLAVFCGVFWMIHRIIHSPFGQVLKAIRENEARALSLGYDVDRYKLLAFVLSATLAGVAGALKAQALGFETLTDVHWHLSGEVVLMTLLGGMGTVLGPVVGAFAIIGMESYFAGFGSWVTVIMGATFVACVLAFRKGVVGQWNAWRVRRARLPELGS